MSSNNASGILNLSDRVQINSLNHRLNRHQVISSNIVNSETPGFRALGYDFEKQLQDAHNLANGLQLKVSNPKHLKSPFVTAGGEVKPDVFIRPSESISEDGNTVDIDREMTQLAQNQILYRSAVEIINRKVGLLKYAIQGG